jgi:hypothetical protein
MSRTSFLYISLDDFGHIPSKSTELLTSDMKHTLATAPYDKG